MASPTGASVRNCSKDRISNIPDDILCHILSFIPTECSVRTRILSTRWKHLFTLVPVLDFSCPRNSDTTANKRFLDFVTWVMNLYNVDKMDRFCYRSDGRLPEPSVLLSWISESIRRGVRELQITTNDYFHKILPHEVFTSQTLTLLKLVGSFELEVPDGVYLPCIKILHLSGETVSDDCMKLFRNCPVLEELFINYGMYVSKKLDISIPTLKRLKFYHYEVEVEMFLDVPNLQYFEYKGWFPCRFSAAHGFELLQIACIDVFACLYNKAETLVNMVRHVQHLRLYAPRLKRYSPSLPMFHNLTRLEIVFISSFSLELLLDHLIRAPRLEVLVLDNKRCSRDGDDPIDHLGHLLPAQVPACVSLHLKEVEVLGFSMLQYEYKLVEYFLKNAKVLDTLKIMFRGSSEKGTRISKKLMTFPMCSKNCRIVFKSGMGER